MNVSTWNKDINEWIGNEMLWLVFRIILVLYGACSFATLFQNSISIIVKRSQQLKHDVQNIIGAIDSSRILKSKGRALDALNTLSEIEKKFYYWIWLSYILQEELIPNAVKQKYHKYFGSCYVSCKNYKNALKHYEELKRLISCDQNLASTDTKNVDIAVVGLIMGDIYLSLNDTTRATVEVTKSIEAFDQYERFHFAAEGYQKLAMIYQSKGCWKQVTSNMKSAISSVQKLRQPISPTNMASVYNELANSLCLTAEDEKDNLKKKKLLNEAITYYEKIIQLNLVDGHGIHWTQEVSEIYKKLGEIHTELTNTKAARMWFSKHKQLCGVLKEKYSMESRTKTFYDRNHKSDRSIKSGKSNEFLLCAR